MPTEPWFQTQVVNLEFSFSSSPSSSSIHQATHTRVLIHLTLISLPNFNYSIKHVSLVEQFQSVRVPKSICFCLFCLCPSFEPKSTHYLDSFIHQHITLNSLNHIMKFSFPYIPFLIHPESIFRQQSASCLADLNWDSCHHAERASCNVVDSRAGRQIAADNLVYFWCTSRLQESGRSVR